MAYTSAASSAATPHDDSGFSVSNAGDVNGNGLADVIVGADGADPNGYDSGRSYVVFGKADTDPVQLSAIAAGTGGFVLDGGVGGDPDPRDRRRITGQRRARDRGMRIGVHDDAHPMT